MKYGEKRSMRTSSGRRPSTRSGRKPTTRSASRDRHRLAELRRRSRRRRQLLDANHGRALDAEEAEHRRAGVRHRHRGGETDDEHERRDPREAPPRHVAAHGSPPQSSEYSRGKIALCRQVNNTCECHEVALEVRQPAPPALPAAARAPARAGTSPCRASSRAQRLCPLRTGRGSTGTRSPHGPRFAAG